MKFWNLLAGLLFIVASSAHAFPLAPVDDLAFKANPTMQFAGYDFSGIVKLSNCSGSLVIFEDQNFDAKAMVLTNGHCVSKGIFGGMMGPREVIFDKAVKRSMTLFKDLKTRFSITSTRIIYATMNSTDMALYELTESYQSIYNRTGVAPFVLSSKRPLAGTEIEIISGYWERGYSCAIDQFVHQLKEGDYIFRDSIRYTPGCDTIGGTSGSPIIDVTTREVIAINNSANESGRQCTMNNPCEIDENGQIYVERGLKYGQQTYTVYTCLTEKKEISLSKPGCVLPK